MRVAKRLYHTVDRAVDKLRLIDRIDVARLDKPHDREKASELRCMRRIEAKELCESQDEEKEADEDSGNDDKCQPLFRHEHKCVLQERRHSFANTNVLLMKIYLFQDGR